MTILRSLLCASLIVGFAAHARSVLAQGTGLPQVSLPVVQTVPEQSAGMKLNDALERLARNPQDIATLIAAGRAALALGDVPAALGFFQRADSLESGNPRVMVELAGAYVQNEDPFSALDLFDAAERLGPIDPARLADRALAYDLVGDNLTAQGYYRQSLLAAPSEETSRRLALSQVISGDFKNMDVTLAPLLQKQDKAAWRIRSFGLAIMGYFDQAEQSVRQTMSAEMATALKPYLRYMPRLTKAQQAAAAALGHFPRASEIGTDDPRLVHYVRSQVHLAAVTVPPSPGQRNDKGRSTGASRRLARAARSAESQAVVRPAGEGAATVPGNPLSIVPPAPLPPSPSSPPVPTAASAPQLPVMAASGGRGTLDDVFSDLSPPSREIEPRAGAVDVRKLKPLALDEPEQKVKKESQTKDAKAGEIKDSQAFGLAKGVKGAKDAKGAKASAEADEARDSKTAVGRKDGKLAKDTRNSENAKNAKNARNAKSARSQPDRIWVQLVSGRAEAAMGYDWKRLVKTRPEQFKARKPYVSSYGQAKRLLTGPFATEKAATQYLAQLKKAGIGGAFVWTSPADHEVTPLSQKR